jgi:bla regulator protein BlaR1
MEWIESILSPIVVFSIWAAEWLALAACVAIVLAVIALAINLVARRWLTANQMSVLWALVLLRLAIPLSGPSVFSLQNLLTEKTNETQPAPATIESWMNQAPSQKPRLPDGTTSVIYDRDEHVVSVTKTIAPGARVVAAALESEPDWTYWPTVVLVIGWPCGAVFILASNLFANWRFSRRVSLAPVCHDPRVLELWARSSALARVRREIPIVLFDGVQQPALMGVLHPRLLLPPDVLALSDEQLQMIMLHELAHVRRRDVAINWLLLVLKAVHWINPVFWLAASRFSSLREQACDAFALRRLGGQSAVNYGELLVTLATCATPSPRWRVFVPASMLSIFSSMFRRRALAARLRALPRAAAVRKRWQAIAIGSATLLLAYCGLTDAKIQEPINSKPEPGLAFGASFEQTDLLETPPEQNTESVTTRDYDIAKLLVTVAGDKLSKDAARAELESMLHFNFVQMPQIRAASDKAGKYDAELKSRFEIDGEQLHLTTTPARHSEFAQQLRAWERSGFGQVSIQIRFITRGEEIEKDAAIPWRYVAPVAPNTSLEQFVDASSQTHPFRVSAQLEEYVPVIYAVLDAESVAKLIDRLQNSTRANLMQAPRPTLFNGQSACLADYSERRFVAAVAEDGAGIVRPKIETGLEGSRLRLQAIIAEDRKTIQLNSGIEFNGVQTARDKQGVEIQVPRMRRFRIDLSSDISANHSLLVRSLNVKPEEDVYVLITPTIIQE